MVLGVVPVALLLILTLEHHDIPEHVPDPGLHTVSPGVSIPIMMQLAITPDRESFTGVQEVKGAAAGHRTRLVQEEEVGGEGGGVGHVGQGQ